MKIINKINPRISAFKFKDEVRGFLTNNQLKMKKYYGLFCRFTQYSYLSEASLVMPYRKGS